MTHILDKYKVSLSSLIAVFILGTALVLLATFWVIINRECNSTALESADNLFEEISAKNIANVNTVLKSISTLTHSAALTFRKEPGPSHAGTLLQDIRPMQVMLDTSPYMMSVYIGYADGTFHQLVAPRGNPAILEKYQAPANCAYINRVIERGTDGTRHQTWRFVDARLVELGSRTDPKSTYDPRTRPWYQLARKAEQTVFTDPYVFASSRLPGLTCARTLADGSGVLGIDITLNQLGEMLAKQKVARHGIIWIVDRKEQIVAYPGLTWKAVIGDDLRLPLASQSPNPLVREISRQIGQTPASQRGHNSLFELDDQSYMARITPMTTQDGLDFSIVVAAPLKDIIGFIDRMALRVVLIALALLIVIIPLAISLARRASRSVRALAVEAEKIQNFDFSPCPELETNITEVQELAEAYDVMRATIQARTASLAATQKKLEQLVQNGLALSGEKKLAKLVTMILHTAKELAQADGGVMYILEDEQLGAEILDLGSKSLVMGGLSENPAPSVKIQPGMGAFLSKESVLHSACQAFNSREVVQISQGDLELFPTGLPDEPKDYRITSLLAVPIISRRDELLGVIQLFNPSHELTCQEGDHDCRDTLSFIGSLAAQAAVTLDNRNLLKSLEELFNALIQVLATSIDAKSAYTAGHCTRVPVLAEMMAQAAHDAQEGPLGDFRMDSDDWRQLWMAAWLHDCGKITTPEYVVDKATKLETVYNRIHEVRTRFEVLRRDAEIDYLKRLAEGNGDPEELSAKLNEQFQRLEDDFVFVAQCNLGGEFMSEEAIQRLKQIAGRTWMSHFSDRLGVSDLELLRKGDEPEPFLPREEPVLADKPDQIIPRTRDYSDIRDVQGNPVAVPENKFNRGELYNLLISRGTLTAEERFIINEHTLNGLEMLGEIPFPDHLAKVPDIAMAHHETMIGTGYPLKKKQDQLPVEARILAIADIFEALTAHDRPYRPVKTVSEALKIMTFMRKDRHIDADLFDLFLKKGIFRQYAEKYLTPSQNDVEDFSPYLHSN